MWRSVRVRSAVAIEGRGSSKGGVIKVLEVVRGEQISE